MIYTDLENKLKINGIRMRNRIRKYLEKRFPDLKGTFIYENERRFNAGTRSF